MSIDVDDIRRRHVSTRRKRCYTCGSQWPCEALQAADEIEALREQLYLLDAAMTHAEHERASV